MRRLVIASTRENAGKTSLIVGLGRASGKPFGYLKPFGDRLLYRKKRLWDYDSALVAEVFGLTMDPREMSIGFDHSKLRFMYDEETTKQKLRELVANAEAGKDAVLIESGGDLTHGVAVNLDAVSLARAMDASLLILMSGADQTVLDDIAFVQRHVNLEGVELMGVVVNKLPDVEDFRNTYETELRDQGVNILGLVPNDPELNYPSVGFLSETLFAKVVTGADAMGSVVENVFVGAMSADAARRQPLFKKARKLVITSGDRDDMILLALEGDTVGLILTNGIAPHSSIISQATERGIPMLLTADDTFKVAKAVDEANYLLRSDEESKLERLTALVRKHVDVATIMGS